MRRPGNPLVRAEIGPVEQGRKPRAERVERLRAAPRKTLFLPDFVESARVAAIPPDEVHAAHAKPARNPDLDRLIFGERCPGAGRPGGGKGQ